MSGAPLAVAQRPETIRITVMTFRTVGIDDPEFGAKVADIMRDKVQDKFAVKDVYVIPTKDVVNTLDQSGFNPNDTLPATEEKSLASLVRADDYITGTVTMVGPKTYRVSAQLVLSRDNTFSQPIPIMQGDKIDHVIDLSANALRDAMKQLPGEKSCAAKARTGDIEGALKQGHRAIADYPNATLARLCIANVQYNYYATAKTRADSARFADSTLAVVGEMLRIDTTNVPALRFATELFKVRGDSAKSLDAAYRLVQANPSDSKLMEQVATEYVLARQPERAIPLVKQLMERNPGDSSTLRFAFSVYTAAHDWNNVVAVGPELVKADTTVADSTYFFRMAAAYDQLQQPQKAAEVLAAGTTKYPRNVEMLTGYARVLRMSGQKEQEGVVLRRIAMLDTRRGALQLAGIYQRQGQLDSAYIVLNQFATQTTLDAGQKEQVAQFAMGLAGQSARHATMAASGQVASTAPGTTATPAAPAPRATVDSLFDLAIKFGQLSDRVSPSDVAKFLGGQSAYQLAASQASATMQTKSCPIAQSAQANMTTAQSMLSGIAATSQYGAPAKEFVGTIQKQLAPFIAQQIKLLCK